MRKHHRHQIEYSNKRVYDLYIETHVDSSKNALIHFQMFYRHTS